MGGDAIAGPFDGEESITLMADLDAGATGTMPSALLPDLIKPVVEHHRAGRRMEAAAAYARILPLINFENRQCGLRATKTVMAAGGVIASDAVRHPLEALHPATKAGLLELAREVSPHRARHRAAVGASIVVGHQADRSPSNGPAIASPHGLDQAAQLCRGTGDLDS